MSSRFPCVTPGICELLHSLSACEVVQFSACGVFVDVGCEISEDLHSFRDVKYLPGYSKSL